MLQVRNFLFVLFVIPIIFSCESKNAKQPIITAANTESADMETRQVGYYGDKINEDGAISGKEMKEKLGHNSSLPVKIKGEVVEVCKTKGCWLHMDMEDGTTLQVNMKDHKFTVPKDITGRLVIAEGTVLRDSVEIEDLSEYAREVGKTEEDARTFLKLDAKLHFEAEGVIIK